MKKRAFTLAEALIALGVVGVVAALMLPLANKARPDEMKISYLKTYDSLSMAVNSLTQASKLYNPVLYSEDLNKTYNIQDYPLLDTYTEKSLNGVNCGTGTKAFGKLLKEVFKGKDIDDGWFATKDGKTFLIESSVSQDHVLTDSSANNVSLYYTITVDLNGTKGVNSLYDKGNVDKPDRFKFFVLPNGALVAADVYGKMYLETRNNSKKVSDDVIASKLEGLTETTEAIIESATEGIFQSKIEIADLDPTDNTVIADSDLGAGGDDLGAGGDDSGDDDGSGVGGSDNDDSDSVGGSWPWTPGTGIGTIGGGITIGTPTIGTPTIGTPTIGTPTIGTPTIGTPTIGTPTIGTPTIGTPTIGTPTIGGGTTIGGGGGGGNGTVVTDPHFDNNGNGTPDLWDCDSTVNLNMSKLEQMACQQQNGNVQFIQNTGW